MERHVFVTSLKPERREEYIDVHKRVPPELISRYRQAGIEKLSVFVHENLMVLYVEATNLQAAQAALVNDPVDVEWQKLVTPMKDPKGPQELTEIFYMG